MRIKRITLQKQSEWPYRLLILSGVVLAFVISFGERVFAFEVNSKNLETEPIQLQTARLIEVNDPPPLIQKEDPRTAKFGDLQETEKVRLITLLLQEYNYSGEDVKTWLHIIKKESGFNEKSEPKYSEVRHCRPLEGIPYAVELEQNSSGMWVQASCRYGDIQTGVEKSYGLLQILPTTAIGHGCENDWKTTWYKQIECGIKVQHRSGWGAWTTYFLAR